MPHEYATRFIDSVELRVKITSCESGTFRNFFIFNLTLSNSLVAFSPIS